MTQNLFKLSLKERIHVDAIRGKVTRREHCSVYLIGLIYEEFPNCRALSPPPHTHPHTHNYRIVSFIIISLIILLRQIFI